MGSEDAATWLMEHYPADGEKFGYAIGAIAHRSWKKSDQIRLAKYYLKKIPFAGASGYEAFISIMAIPRFIDIVSKYIPKDRSRVSLLRYYIEKPLLENARTASDEKIVCEFIDKLRRTIETPE